MSEKLRVGILGGTGMVGQRFITLLKIILGLRLYWLQRAVVPQESFTKKL